MTEHQLVSDDVKRAVVEAYKRGDKIRDIEEAHGIARATVYWILEQGGVTPNRLQRGRRLVGDDQQLAQLYLLIEAQEKRIKELTTAGITMAEYIKARIADIEADVDLTKRPKRFYRSIEKQLDDFVTRLEG